LLCNLVYLCQSMRWATSEAEEHVGIQNGCASWLCCGVRDVYHKSGRESFLFTFDADMYWVSVGQAKGQPVELTEERALAFGERLLLSVAAEVANGKPSIIPCVHFLQGLPSFVSLLGI
jgi:hypothetical protein